MLIGLTGGFGSGKSTVLEMFEEMGAFTLSADGIVHELLKKPEIKAEIRAAFGPEVFSGDEVDRKRLAKRVFSSPRARRKLEEILHPLVYQYVSSFHHDKPNEIVVVEVPLLFESGGQANFDMVILVSCDPQKAVERLKKRGFTEEEAWQRLSVQMPLEAKARLSDLVIDNSGSLEETRRQVQGLWNSLIQTRKGSFA